MLDPTNWFLIALKNPLLISDIVNNIEL
jgi:hypothetical protein